jgi:hypothetical protein
MTESTVPPLVEPVVVARIGQQSKTIRFEAGPEARAALAARFGLIELTAFSADATLRRRRDTGWIELKGSLSARVVQECVVTLEPIAAAIEAEIDELFEEPEPLEDELLDVGEVIAQVLSLSLDPFPRAPGVPPVVVAAAEQPEEADDPQEGGASPFAALAMLKDRDVKKR